MFNHSKMILDPLVSDVGYDKEKPEMDDGRSSLRWWISQRMTLKSTVSPLTSSLSGGDADKSQQGDDKKCPRRSRVSVFAPISISRQARRASLDCCQAYFSKMVAIPARADEIPSTTRGGEEQEFASVAFEIQMGMFPIADPIRRMGKRYVSYGRYDDDADTLSCANLSACVCVWRRNL